MSKIIRFMLTKMRLRRQELKLSQQAVGYQAGMSSADVSRIENARMVPYPSQAQRLAQVLKLDAKDLQEQVKVEVVAG